MATAQLQDLHLIQSGDVVSGWTPLLVARGLQVAAPLRARNAVQYDRKGALVGYRFSVSRTHADYAAAGAYLDALPRLVARAFGSFSADRGLGGEGISLVNAAITDMQAEPHVGVRTQVAFTVVGSLPESVT